MAQTVNEIAEILTDMRYQNDENAKNFEKVLTGINTKLELLSDNELVDSIRIYISELKKVLEDRENITSLRFDELSKNINSLINLQDENAKTDDINILFTGLNTSFNNFLKETAERKETLNDIEQKVFQINTKAFDKEEIISLIQGVSSDLLSVNANIEKTFLETAEVVRGLDSSEKFEEISNQIKNFATDFSDKMEVIKEEFHQNAFANLENSSKIVDGISDISDKISNLEDGFNKKSGDNFESLKSALDSLTEKISKDFEAQKQLVIDKTNNSIQLEGLQKLSEDIKAVESIVYAGTSEFNNSIKSNLAEIKGYIGDMTSSVNSTKLESDEKLLSKLANLDILSTTFESAISAVNSGIKNVLDNILSISNSSSEVKNKTDNIIESFSNVSDLLSEVSAKNKEISSSVFTLNEKVFANEQDIKDKAEILESEIKINREKISEVATAVNSIENFDYSFDLQEITSKIDELSILFEDNSSKNYENLSNKINTISDLLYSLKSVIDNSNSANSEIFDKQFEKFKEAMAHIMTAEDFILYKSELSEYISRLQDGSDIIKFNSESIKSDLNEISEKLNGINYDIEIKNIAGSINDIRLSFENNSKMNYENIVNEINNFKSELKNNLISNDNSQQLEQINLAISDLLSNIQLLRDISVQKNSEILDDISSQLNSSISSITSDINTNSDINFGEIKQSVEKISSDLDNMKHELSTENSSNTESVTTGFANLKSSLENIYSILESSKAEFENISTLKEMFSKLISEVDLFKTEQEQIINDAKETHSNQLRMVSENVNDAKAQINEALEGLKNYIQELENATGNKTYEGLEKVSQKLNDLENLFSQSSLENQQKTDIFTSRLSEFVQIVENSNADTEGKISSSVEEISALKENLVEVSENLKVMKLSNDDKFKETISLLDAGVENVIFNINSLSDNLKSGLEDSVKENIATLSEKFIEILNILSNIRETYSKDEILNEIENKTSSINDELTLISTDITQALDNKTENILRAFDPIKTGIDEFIGFDFEKILADIKSQIELSFMNFSMDVNSELVSNSETFARVEQAYKEAYNKISNIEECVTEKIQNNIELLNTAIESGTKDIKQKLSDGFSVQSEDIKAHIDLATNIVNKDFAEKYENLSGNITSLSDNLKSFVVEVLKKIVEATNPAETKNLIETIISNNKEFKNKVDEISSKIDIIVTDPSSDTIIQKFDDISESDKIMSDMINVLNAKIDTIASDTMLENVFEEVEDVKNILEEQSKILEEQSKNFESSTDEKLSAIDKYLKDVIVKLDNIDIDKNAEDIKTSIMNALLALIDQISFVEEAEDIKDFVEEKTGEINQNIIEVQNQLKQLTSNDDDSFDYKYTLQDVESDIAKLRLAINNIQGSDYSDLSDGIKKIVDSIENLESTLTQDQMIDLKSDVEKLNEDIMSISYRTNKLLLNSDESYKVLNEGLDNFGRVINQLESRIVYLDNTEISERIEEKIDKLRMLAADSAMADKTFHQAMIYLGEWVDSTTENISSILEKTEQISKLQKKFDEIYEIVSVKDIKLNQIKASIPEKDELIDEIRAILPDNSLILDKIKTKFAKQEAKIQELENKIEKLVSKFEENDDMMLNRKIDKIETILSGLSRNIEKLTSYVDE